MILSWLRNRRRRRILAEPFPADWQRLLERRLRHYRHLPAEQRRRLYQIVQVMVVEKEWAGAGDLEITVDMKVTIAGEAAVMVSGHEPPYFFDRLHTLVIHPGTVRFTPHQVARNENLPAGAADGIAWHRGPVVLSWARLRRELMGQSPGHNVVLHEFAHHLDGLVGEIDGSPPLGDAKREQQWYAVTEAEYFRLVGNARREEATLLDHYGATHRAEFFAVATECFFEVPHELRERHRELYETLADFYHQSPAEWLPRHEGAVDLPTDANGQYVDIDLRRKRRSDHARLRALRDLPTADALFAVGLEHLRLEQPEEAVRVFSRLIELDPQDEESLSQRAIALFQLERFPEAQADCEAALAIDPGDIDALCVRGEIFLQEGKVDEALAALSAAVTESPGDADARVSRARAWLAAGRARKALSDLNEALKREPYLAEAHFERGRAHESLGRTREAEQDFRRAALLEPDGDWQRR